MCGIPRGINLLQGSWSWIDSDRHQLTLFLYSQEHWDGQVLWPVLRECVEFVVCLLSSNFLFAIFVECESRTLMTLFGEGGQKEELAPYG